MMHGHTYIKLLELFSSFFYCTVFRQLQHYCQQLSSVKQGLSLLNE